MFKNSLLTIALAALLAVANASSGSAVADNAPVSGEQIDWQVVSGGASLGASPAFKLAGTAGQTATGGGSSSTFRVREGFWLSQGVGCDCGDANSDGIKNITDAVFLINYIFSSGPEPTPLCQGDANGDTIANITDAVYVIAYIFSSGPAPHCP
ncbi:MAG: dockerin type I repeat-containing protein [bacterium]